MVDVDELQLSLAQIVKKLNQNYSMIDKLGAIPGFRQTAEDKVNLNFLKKESAALEKDKSSLQDKISKAVEDSEKEPAQEQASINPGKSGFFGKVKGTGKKLAFGAIGAGAGWLGAKLTSRGSSGSPNKSSGSSTSVSPILIFILTLANYFYHWNVGFRIDAITVLIDFFTFFVFYFAFGKWGLALIPFLLQTIIPGLLILAPGLVFIISSFISIALVLPWFVIFAILYELKLNPDSSSTKFVAVICVIAVSVVLVPSFLSAVRSSDYVINQKLIGDAKENIGNIYKENIQGLINQVKVSYCSLTKSKSECEKQYIDVQKQFLEKLNIDSSLNTGFTMDVPYNLFVTEGQPIFENKITSYLTAKNDLTKEIKLKFGCGLENRGKGTPIPETDPVLTGAPLNQKSIACTIDTTRKGTPTFYFNVTAQDVLSTGYTDILITNKATKDAVLAKYPGISENQILTLSKEFGFAIKSKESSLNPKVGKNDLVQPIIYTGVVTTFNAPATLLFGVEKQTEVDLAIFLKNNGNGLISSISNIEIALPSDMEYVGDKDCGITGETYKTDWRKIKKGSILPIKSCKVRFIGDKYPNTAETRTLGITITYDYMITRTQMVNIA